MELHNRKYAEKTQNTHFVHSLFEYTKHSYQQVFIDARKAAQYGSLLQIAKSAVCGQLVQLRIVIDRLRCFARAVMLSFKSHKITRLPR